MPAKACVVVPPFKATAYDDDALTSWMRPGVGLPPFAASSSSWGSISQLVASLSILWKFILNHFIFLRRTFLRKVYCNVFLALTIFGPSTVTSTSLPTLPLLASQGLIALYTADSWQPAESRVAATWMDLSGLGNHVTEIGGTTNISVARPVGAPAYIYGASTAWMKFPVGILPSADYTLFFVARYNGAQRQRIFQTIDKNFYFGFHGGKGGVAYHHSSDFCRSITQSNIDLHGSEWVLGADRSDSFRSNGVDRTTPNRCADFGRLAINTGFQEEEKSDFAVQYVIVYNRKLTDIEVMSVEAWLASQQPAFSPANLQVIVCDSSLPGATKRCNINHVSDFLVVNCMSGGCWFLRRTRCHRLRQQLLLVSPRGHTWPSHRHGQRQQRWLGCWPEHGNSKQNRYHWVTGVYLYGRI
jgi:hypothetical protein